MDLNQERRLIAKYLQDNTFPEMFVPHKESFRLLFYERLPFLIFFNQEQENPLVPVLKALALQYREYFLFMLVDFSDDNLDAEKSIFLKEFLGVGHSPALRILKLGERVARHRFIGTLEENSIEFFLQNYLYDNLANYVVNQHIEKPFSGQLKNINSEYFEKSIPRSGKHHLVMIYSRFLKQNNVQQSLEAFKKTQQIYSLDKGLEFDLLNQDKNSIANLYFGDLPKFMLIKSDGYFVVFKESASLQKFQEFLDEHVPGLQKIDQDL